MAGELMQHEEQPTRYGAWREERQHGQAVKFAAIPASEQREPEVNSDKEDEPMARERGPKRTVGLRVDPEIYEEFEDRAGLAGKSVSEFLRDLLVSSESPALRRRRLLELLKKAVDELRQVAAEEGPRKVVKQDLFGFSSRVLEQPSDAAVLADKIEQFMKKNLSESKPRPRVKT
ncbi:MAG: hypothetical protein WA876_01155 [Candidatus Acidiferrales bacterium]